ncbi:MAG: hypothetical protein FWD86_01050 [Firmicutes bacterium]|nr:hypothetical protein [Bacillota bacterium]
MKKIQFMPKFKKNLLPPPDKSILIRALITGGFFGKYLPPLVLSFDKKALLPLCEDVSSAILCLSQLNAELKTKKGQISVLPITQFDFEAPKTLNAGNSATVLRLVLGAAAAHNIPIEISGDASLNARSHQSTIEALEHIGANFEKPKKKRINQAINPNQNQIPIVLLKSETKISGKIFRPKSPSAQTKSAVLLASLTAKQKATIEEKIKTRDHTERLLSFLNLSNDLINNFDANQKNLPPNQKPPKPIILKIPPCISSSSFLIARALLTLNGRLKIKSVGLNETRAEFLNILKQSGFDISIKKTALFGHEQVGQIIAKGAKISKKEPKKYLPISINEQNIVSVIDEVPILAVMACFCEGKSVFSGLSALRNKESDRAEQIFNMLKSFGARVSLDGDTLEIVGNKAIKGLQKGAHFIASKDCPVVSSSDHRIVMAGAVFGSVVENGCNILNPEAIKVSYPNFFKDMGLN